MRMKRVLLAVLILFLSAIATSALGYSQYIPRGRVAPGIYAIRNYNNGLPFVNFFLVQTGQSYIAFDAGSDSAQTEIALQRLDISPDDVIAVFVTHDDADHIGSLELFANANIYKWPMMYDGEIIEAYGVSIQAFHTPGHTSGCMTYLVDGRHLFVGDLMVNPNFARYDSQLQIANREMMLAMDGVESVFTGHFGLVRRVEFFRWWLGVHTISTCENPV